MLRGALAFILVLVFIPLFVVTLLLIRAQATLYDPDFYARELRRSGTYDFIHTDYLPAALDEATDDAERLRIDIAPARDEALSYAREVLPPQWLQQQTEQALVHAVPYMTGATDSFSVTVPLQGRAEIATGALKRNVSEGDMFPVFYDAAMAHIAERVTSEARELPFGVRLSQAEIEGYLRRLAPQVWARPQMVRTVDQATPYLTGEADRFSVTYPLSDRADEGGEILKEILRKGELYEFVVGRIVVPSIERAVGPAVQVAFGVEISRGQVVTAVRGVLTREWAAQVEDALVNETVAYVTGRDATFDLNVPLEEPKRAAIAALTSEYERYLREQYNALPTCGLGEIPFFDPLGGTFPTCRPPGMSYEEAKRVLGLGSLDFESMIQRAIGSQIPDRVVFSEAALRRALGAEQERTLDRIRKWVMNGATFTEADLRRPLSAGQAQRLDSVRAALRDGVTVTDVHLQAAIAAGGGTGTRQDLQSFRSMMRTLRYALPFAAIASGVVLALVMWVGGSTWPQRFLWAALALAAGALTLLVLTWPVYDLAARPGLEAGITQASISMEGVDAVAAAHGARLVVNAADTFVLGLRTQAGALLALAIIVGVAAIVLQRRPVRWARRTAVTTP